MGITLKMVVSATFMSKRHYDSLWHELPEHLKEVLGSYKRKRAIVEMVDLCSEDILEIETLLEKFSIDTKKKIERVNNG